MKFISEYLEFFNGSNSNEENIKIIKEAILQGIDINNIGPFIHPLALANFEETTILIEAGIKIKGPYEEMILFQSIKSGELIYNTDVILKKMDLLIENGLNINLKNSNNENILFACKSSQIFLYFFDKIKNIGLLNNKNENILFYITKKEWYNLHIIFKGLFENKDLNLNQINNDNQNLLFFVKNRVLLNYLINKNLDINLSDIQGNTPLMSCYCPDIAMELIAHGADIHKKNHDGKNALNSLSIHEKIVKKLIENNIEVTNFPENFIYSDNFSLVKEHHLKMIEAEKEVLKGGIINTENNSVIYISLKKEALRI